MLSRRTMMLISQVYIVILAYAFVAFPRYVWLLFLIYLGLMMGLSAYSARGSVKAGVTRADIERARQLLREENAFQLAMEDEELLALYSKQMKVSMMSFAVLILYLPLFYIVRYYYKSLVGFLKSIGAPSDTVAGFIIWLVLFELMTVVSFLIQKRGGIGDKPIVPMVPKGFVVTDKGILLKGSLGRIIGFPLPEGTRVEVNEAKGYVEIIEPKGARIRLYTMKAKRLYEIIQRYGFRKKKEES